MSSPSSRPRSPSQSTPQSPDLSSALSAAKASSLAKPAPWTSPTPSGAAASPRFVANILPELARLSSISGRDAITEAASDGGLSCAGWNDELPADVAARLLALRASEEGGGPWKALFERAHRRLDRVLPEVPTRQRLGVHRAR